MQSDALRYTRTYTSLSVSSAAAPPYVFLYFDPPLYRPRCLTLAHLLYLVIIIYSYTSATLLLYTFRSSVPGAIDVHKERRVSNPPALSIHLCPSAFYCLWVLTHNYAAASFYTPCQDL